MRKDQPMKIHDVPAGARIEYRVDKPYRDLQAVRAYRYKGINIVVGIDYVKREVSLLGRSQQGNYTRKEYIFAKRGLEYMQGWQNILDAMKFAIEQATEELQAEEERSAEEMAKLLFLLQNDTLDKQPKQEDTDDEG